jgi:hypothetical protein
VGQRADLDVHPDEAAQRRGEGGLADVPVAGVGDDDDVGGEALLVGLEQLDEGVGADLLLALELTGRSSPKIRTAPRWAAMPALSSAAPRP